MNFLLIMLTILSFSTNAATGKLFFVSRSGAILPHPVSFTLCLNVNGNTHLSCQNFSSRRAHLNIRTTIPNYTYIAAGIRVNTKGYSYIPDPNTALNPNVMVPGFVGIVLNDISPSGGLLSGPTDATYTLGGTITGLKGQVVLVNNGSEEYMDVADGPFTFPDRYLAGSRYRVTIKSQPLNQTCTVNNGTGVITQNVTNIKVHCSTITKTVGGTVSGLSGTVILQNNDSDNLTINSNGSFTFPTPVAQGAEYKVTVLTQPATQTCTVNNSTGTIGLSNITDVRVICSTNYHTVGGTISGLNGPVVLQNNSDDNLTLTAPGSFTFQKPVAEGANYNVEIVSEPSDQTCTITNRSGTMGNADVTNVMVNCVTNMTSLTISTNDLALSISGLTEYGTNNPPEPSGRPRSVTITNNGPQPTFNLNYTFPNWPSGTTATTCPSVLNPGESCAITISPGDTPTSNGTSPCSDGTAPVPQVISARASNSNGVSANVVILDYGCIYAGGYVYAFDDTSPSNSVGGKVISKVNVSPQNGTVWSSNGVSSVNVSEDMLPGIDDTSTSSSGSPTYLQFAANYNSNYGSPFPPPTTITLSLQPMRWSIRRSLQHR